MSRVMFDYGGVICRPQPEPDLARLAGVAGATWPQLRDAYWSHRRSYDLAELDGESFWQKVGGALGTAFSAAEITELIRLDTASWLHLDPDTVALLGDLRAAGHRLALLSNAPVEVAGAVANLPLAAAFEQLAFSCFLGAAKPDPACYRRVLESLGAAAGDTVFVDDRPENVASARELGMRAVHFTGAAQARVELERHGVHAGRAAPWAPGEQSSPDLPDASPSGQL